MGALGFSALALRLVRARGRSESAVPIYFRSAARVVTVNVGCVLPAKVPGAGVDMSPINPSSTAREALHLEGMQLEEAAAKIAGAGASSLDGSNVDLVDLSTEIVALMSA